MDKIIGKGSISANSVIIYSSTISKLFGKKKISLSFSDSDAYPFARFLIMGINQEMQNMFLVGKQGTTHGSLFQIANIKNQKVLGQDWTRNSKYKELTSILSSGRIWTSKKIIVMRDARPSPNIVQYAVTQLMQNGISDITSYKLLYEDNNQNIHECMVEDYINGCASEFGYKTTEEINLKDINTSTKRFGEPNGMTQAEYNYYRRYGLGDNITPRIANLTEKRLRNIIAESIRKVLFQQ